MTKGGTYALALAIAGAGGAIIYLGTRVDRATTTTDRLGGSALGLLGGLFGQGDSKR